MDQFFDFLKEYLLLLLGIPLQLMGLLAAKTLKAKRMAISRALIFVGSLLLIVVFAFICISQVLTDHPTFKVFDYWASRDGMMILMGGWLFGMASQMVGLLLLVLRCKSDFARLAVLEKKVASLKEKTKVDEKGQKAITKTVMLSYTEVGSSDDEPLLFFHGLGASAKQAISMLTDLKGTRLIAPDMPGHGESLAFDPATFSFDEFADHAIALLDELKIKKTNIGGLSMGSGIALNLALRYPERVKKVVLLRPSWLDQRKPEHLLLVAKVGEWIDTHGEEAATAKLALHPEYQKLAEENVPVAESLTALLDRPKDKATTQVLFKMWESRPFASLSELIQLSNKTLVMDTPRDELHPKAIATALAEVLPNVETTTLPPRYHEPKAYQTALNEAFNKFLAE